MTLSTRGPLTVSVLLIAASALTFSGSASAAPPTTLQVTDTTYAAGLGCAGFDLNVKSTEGKLQTVQLLDGGGNPVRIVVSVGTGVSFTYTNVTTGKQITTKGSGSATKVVTTDAIQTVTQSGLNALILFPTDVPAGPSTTAYRGQIVFTIDTTTGVFTLISHSGASLDVCKALS
jgi:hypothetical protein